MSDTNPIKPFFASITAREQDLNTVPVKQYLRRNIVQAGLIPDKYVKRSKHGELQDDIAFTPPYSKGYLTRLANAYEFDAIVRTGVDTLVHYVMGRDYNISLYPVSRNVVKTKEELTAALNAVLSEQEQEKLLDFITAVDNACDIKSHIKGALVQKYIYGRSAILIERAGREIELSAELKEKGLFKGVPIYLKLLSSFYLTQNHYNTKTWEVEEIEYDDPSWVRDESKSVDDQPALPIDDLIYFTHNDYNIAPNSNGYGLSAIQSVLALSGANRTIDERVLPELNTSAYAGTGIFKFVGMSSAEMENFVNSLDPATFKATNQIVEYIPVQLQYNMDHIISQRDSNTRRIGTAIRIPSVLINHEEVTNRATNDRITNIWQQGDLEFARDELRDQMWKYWYRRLMEIYFPDSEFLYLKAKIIMEFKNVDFSNFFEKGIAASNLVTTGIISVREARELLNYPPYTEDQEEMADLLKGDIEEIHREENFEREDQRADELQQAMKGQPKGTRLSSIKGKVSSGQVASRIKRQARIV